MSYPALRHVAAVAALALGASACTTVEAAPSASAATVNVVTVTAGDFYFQMPDTLPAGLTNFRLINRGKELHHVQAVQLREGRTLQDLLAAMSKSGGHGLPAWATFVGGPNTGVPGGGQTETAFELEPGTYAILCVIPSPDGTPHLMKGMMKQVTVVPATGAVARTLTADATVVLDDYRFDITPTLTAGRRVLRVENRAAQPHEIVIAQLAPGKTAADLLTWMETGMQGPPPGRPLGGTSGFAAGVVNYVTVDFAPGSYALICFIPDAKDGRPHTAHGMVAELSIE